MLPFSCSRGKYLAKHGQDIKKTVLKRREMKKLVSFLVLALLAIPSLTFSATTHDMLEDKWYYSNTFKSEGNDVYAKLTNREDLYDGTNYSGDCKVQF